MSEYRDRICELRRVRASDLVPNPKNWREHPDPQRSALRTVLSEVGVADAVLARETDDGRLMLIDGHLRTEELGDAEIPVLVLDIDEAEADVVLATYDPLSAMANSGAEALTGLLAGINAQTDELDNLLRQIAEDGGAEPPDFQPTPEDEQPALDITVTITCPKCGHEFQK